LSKILKFSHTKKFKRIKFHKGKYENMKNLFFMNILFVEMKISKLIIGTTNVFITSNSSGRCSTKEVTCSLAGAAGRPPGFISDPMGIRLAGVKLNSTQLNSPPFLGT